MFKNLIKLSILALVMYFSTGQIYSQGCNCFTGWLYRVPVTITNSNASAYTNFEVRDSINTAALVTAGKMKADGGDIRFADSLCNPLSYYVMSGINTNATIIWVKVPSLPASGTRTVYMYYGNQSATSLSNANNTFAFYEGFDGNNLGRFSAACGSGNNATFASGVATFSWTSSGIWASDSALSNTEVYTTEANVTAASGNWPGIYAIRNTGTHQSMALLMGSGNVRVSKTPISGTTPYCNGHNFVSPTMSAATPAGIWAFTWISTGSQVASFPGDGTWTTADSEQPKDAPLNIGLGSISSGNGSFSVDWVLARKYAPLQPSAANGSESSAPKSPGNSLTATVLGSSSIRINWADSSSNEDKFLIDRSTNGGTNWVLRDSVAANTTQYTDVGLTQNTEYCYRVYAKNCIGLSPFSNTVCETTTFIGIVQNGNEIPKVFNLYQNYPNPFNPATNIKFDIPKSSFVKLVIYDITGKQVAELVNSQLSAGSYSAEWNATSFASGIYFYRIDAGDYVQQMKMVLVK